MMMRMIAAAAMALVSLALAPAGRVEAQGDKRVALVIGNSAYTHAGRLANPVNDAEDIGAALRKLGFQVILEKDLDKRGMDDAFRRFARASVGADVAMFYYAGHAMQFNGTNYLMPVDAKLADETDLPYEMAKASDVIDDLQRARGVRIVVLDGCRDNPLEVKLKRSISQSRSTAKTRGLAPMDSAQGILVAFATQNGTTADDGDGTRNSPFTSAFLKHVNTPGLEVSSFFKRIRSEVHSATNGRQIPELSDSLIGDFAFVPGGKPGPSDNAATGADELMWGFLKDTTDVGALRRFLAQFPQTTRRIEVEQRIAALSAPTPTPAPPRPQPPPPGPVLGMVDPRNLPPVPTNTTDADCDRFAGSPHDADRAPGFPGVELEQIDAARAVPACRAAVGRNAGVTRFEFALGRSLLRSGDVAGAREVMLRLAGTGHAGAMNAIGAMFLDGQGLPKDESQARQWFDRSARAGNVLAMHNMGKLYERGAGGLTRDLGTARQWIERAAAGGLAAAMNTMGEYYLDGVGVPRSDTEALRWFERGATAGNPAAMVNIGYFYEHGRGGLPTDAVQARQWYERSAIGGNMVGMSNFGLFLEIGKGGGKDIQQARLWYERSANLGYGSAMTNLAWLLESGDLGPKDFAQARLWYGRAVEKNAARAMNNLAYLHETGLGGPIDLSQARTLYERAAGLGHALAMANLGDLYDAGRGVPKDQAQARQWYEKAVAAGNAGAMNSLGIYYESGIGGLPKSFVDAARLYERAANLGNASAANNLGILYENGQGVPQSYTDARRWYEKGSNAGNRSAMNNLGVLMELGRGGAKDEAGAFRLYEKAAGLGNTNAMYNLGLMYANGVAVGKDFTQARLWYEKAVNGGSNSAMNNLAILLENGQGGPQDYTRARNLYERAAGLGNHRAMFNVGLMYEAGRGVGKDDAQARAWYERAIQGSHAGAMDSLGLLLMNGRGGPADTQRAAIMFLNALRLGDAAAKKRLTETPTQLTHDTRVAVQRQLIREGVLSGAADGNFGASTLRALQQYAERR